MRQQLQAVAQADEVTAVADGAQLFLSGMVTLGLMESLWRNGLLWGPLR